MVLGPGTQIKIKPQSFVSDNLELTLLQGSVNVNRSKRTRNSIILTAGNKKVTLDRKNSAQLIYRGNSVNIKNKSGQIKIQEKFGKTINFTGHKLSLNVEPEILQKEKIKDS